MTDEALASGASPADALAALWAAARLDPEALERVTIAGDDPVLPSAFRVGTAAAASIGAAGLAAAERWRAATGQAQDVRVEVRDAAAMFRSERYMRVLGRPPDAMWDAVAGLYPTGDERWIRLHTNFKHHRDAALAVLDAPYDREAVARAVAGRAGEALEAELVAAGSCAALVRSAEEWAAHPQGAAVAGLPLFEIDRIGEAPAEPAGAGARPLEGVRVLDLTRVLAGPVCGRCLAGHGAEVIRVASPSLPSIEPAVIDTGFGKRSTFLDLRQPSDREQLWALVREADVFVQAYRPGALDALGFSLEAVAQARPGIVYVTLSAYGHTGPWAGRRGFDSLVQCSAGIADDGARGSGSAEPVPLPCQALDHATGYLAAFGAMAALAHRAREGGSWRVRLSLAQTARWLDGLGRVEGASIADTARGDVADLLETAETPFGTVEHVRPAEQLSATPARWERPPEPLGSSPPRWSG
jgi:crotonobetainyl-CoA:carnitine CoA-transferase CaiB-like acyl-CoA transferase